MVYIPYNAHSKSILLVILRVQPTLHDWQFTRYGKSYNFIIIRPQKINGISEALLVFWEVNISENTHSKSSLAMILRSQPTFYDQQFVRFGFWAILGLFVPILAQKMGSPSLQPDHLINPENKPSKDSETTASSV